MRREVIKYQGQFWLHCKKGMIEKLEKQASDEATQEAFCQEENAKSAKKRDSLNASVDKYNL